MKELSPILFAYNNQFLITKISLSANPVKEGWVNRETGRVGDPRIQFLNMEEYHSLYFIMVSL